MPKTASFRLATLFWIVFSAALFLLGLTFNQGPDIATVVVAKCNLEHNTILTKQDVELKQFPVHLIPNGPATSNSEVHDMLLVTSLRAGQIIFLDDVVHPHQLHTSRGGFRLVDIKVSDTYSDLRAGDTVSIWSGELQVADSVLVFNIRGERKGVRSLIGRIGREV